MHYNGVKSHREKRLRNFEKTTWYHLVFRGSLRIQWMSSCNVETYDFERRFVVFLSQTYCYALQITVCLIVVRVIFLDPFPWLRYMECC